MSKNFEKDPPPNPAQASHGEDDPSPTPAVTTKKLRGKQAAEHTAKGWEDAQGVAIEDGSSSQEATAIKETGRNAI